MPANRLFKNARTAQSCAWAVAFGIATLWYPHTRSGVAFGGLIMAVNLALMTYLTDKLQNGAAAQGVYAAALGCKFVLLMAGVVAIMQGFDPDLLGFAAGLSTFFVGMAAAAWSNRAQPGSAADNAPPLSPAT